MVHMQEFANDLRNYFKCCPICFASAKGTFSAHITAGEKDTLTCNICGAKWSVYIVPFRGFEWAVLDSPAKDGRGHDMQGKRLDKKEILALTQKDCIDQKNQSTVTKEIIREKEIVTRVRCPYCHNAYNEALEKCPQCGAKN